MRSESPAWDFTIHSGQYRVRVVPEGRGYRAKLISSGIGTIMEPHGRSPTEALITLARELYETESVFERKLAKDIVRHTALPIVLGSSARSHSTKKQSDDVSVGDEVYAVSGGRRHGPGIVEEIYDDGTMRVDFTRQFAGRLRVRPQDLIYVPPK